MSQATGPRTTEGKKRSSANARKHGFSGRTLIVDEHEQPELEAFIDEWENEIEPCGVVEAELFGQLINAAWTLRRISAAEAHLIASSAVDPLISDDPAVQNKLRLLSIYQSRAERSFHKAKAELQKIQEERLFREAALGEEHGLPTLPRSTVVRREIVRDKRTQAKAEAQEIEDFIFSPPPGQSRHR